MICDRCGNKIDEKDSRCPICGKTIEKKETDSLNIFNSKIINNEEKQEEKIVDKYKNNIKFFNLSSEKTNDENTNENIFTKDFKFEEDEPKTIEPINITPIADLNFQTNQSLNTENEFNSINNNLKQDDSINNLNLNQIDSNLANLNLETSQNLNNTLEEKSDKLIEPSNENAKEKTPKKENDKSNSLIVIVAIIFIALIAISVLLINGKTKTITCSNNIFEDSINGEYSIISTFKDDKIETMKIKGNEQINNDQEEYVNLYFNYKNEELSKYTQINGVIVSTNKKGNSITYTITANNNSNSKKLLKEEFGTNKEAAENFITQAEELGYKCTTK